MITNTVLARNLRRELDRSGRTAKAVSLDAGLNASFCADILRGKAKNPAASRLAALAKALGIPVARLTDDEALGPAPSSVTIRASRGEKGTLHLEIPGSASLPQDEAIKLLQLYGAAESGQRQRILMALQNPGLFPAGPLDLALSEDEIEQVIESTLSELQLDRLERIRVLQALIAAVRALRGSSPAADEPKPHSPARSAKAR